MARVTVEDCVLRIPNRFQLVMLAAQRARNISAGAQLTIDRDNDKNPVVALREIADETIALPELEESLIKGLQNYVEMDEPEEDELDLAAIEQELSGETGEADVKAEILEDLLQVDEDAELEGEAPADEADLDEGDEEEPA